MSLFCKLQQIVAIREVAHPTQLTSQNGAIFLIFNGFNMPIYWDLLAVNFN